MNKEQFYFCSICYVVILRLFMQVYGCQGIGKISKLEVLYSVGLAIFMTNLMTGFALLCLIKNAFVIHNMVGVIIVQFISAGIGISIQEWFWRRISLPQNIVAIINDEILEEAFLKKMRLESQYRIKAVLKDVHNIAQIKAYIDQHQAVLLGNINSQLKEQIINYCYEVNAQIYMIPKVEDILLQNAEVEQVVDTPMYAYRNFSLKQEQKSMKRFMDLVLGCIGFVLAMPFMAIVACAIKLEDGGPVFYCQKRVTENGKHFYILKFRSMIVDAEKDGKPRLATVEDSRITKVGRIIRATRLDELPQIINIIKGDMSIVGPRPERPEILEDYAKEFPQIQYRNKVKAGLTGLAQVQGRYNTSPRDKLLFDLTYIQNYSMLLDIKIIFMTVKILFLKESTQGIAEEQEVTLG